MESSSSPQSDALGLLTIPIDGDNMTVTTLIDLLGVVIDAIPYRMVDDYYWFDSLGVYFEYFAETDIETIIKALERSEQFNDLANRVTFETYD